LADQRFSKTAKLRRSEDFRRVRELGEKRHSFYFLIYFLQKPDGPTRVGITVSRKVGGAVTRNRIKRLVREAFRLNYQELPAHADFSIIAKKHAGDVIFDQVLRDFLILTCPPESQEGS